MPMHGVAADAEAIKFKTGGTRANNAHIKLAPNGTVGLSNNAGAAVHVILDVSGFYR